MITIPQSLWTEQSTDTELIAAVREGDSDAFGTLFLRHSGAAARVASMYARSPSDVDDIVSEAFSQVFRVLRDGGGPDFSFRAYLYTVVRRTGLDLIRKANQVRPDEDMERHEEAIGYLAASDHAGLIDFEENVVTEAFKSLPERWQEVLWYTEVEKKTAAEAAPALGLTPNGVAALAYRAREALRQAYLQHHLASTDDPTCLTVVEDLAGFVRGSLSARRRAKVSAHIETCKRCSALVSELEDVNGGIR